MAGKCKEMSKIKQVIRLYKDGMSKRAIGRELGLYKGTVNKYVGLAEADSLSLDELLKLEDPVLEKRLTGGNPAYSDKRFDDLQDRLPYIAKELADKDRPMSPVISFGKSTRRTILTGMSIPSSAFMSTNIPRPRNRPS